MAMAKRPGARADALVRRYHHIPAHSNRHPPSVL